MLLWVYFVKISERDNSDSNVLNALNVLCYLDQKYSGGLMDVVTLWFSQIIWIIKYYSDSELLLERNAKKLKHFKTFTFDTITSQQQKRKTGYGYAVVVFILSCHLFTLIGNSKCQMAKIMFLAHKVLDSALLLKVKIIQLNGGYIGTMWQGRTLIFLLKMMARSLALGNVAGN